MTIWTENDIGTITYVSTAVRIHASASSQRRATTHWGYAALLPLVGATHEKRRVVRDGKLITAGGVTPGIDFGLEVVADIAGERLATA
jgi:transcriptional regulator GlxA family with amidase domain